MKLPIPFFKTRFLVFIMLWLSSALLAQTTPENALTNPQLQERIDRRVERLKERYPERFAKMDETDLQLFREQELRMMHRENLLTDNGEIMPPKGISDNSRVSTNDSLALVALYNATGGQNWINKTNWLTGMVDTWYGITVTDGFVTQISLSSNQLTSSIPAEIENLTNLQTLSLSWNQITGSIPATIGNLTNLQALSLSGNQFTGSIPATIGNLTNLQSLYLYFDNLTGSIPDEIGNLTNLQNLELAENQLTGSIPTTIGNMTNLQTLHLSWNQFTGNIPTEIGNLTNLHVLTLRHNYLSGSIPNEIGNLTNLEGLSLGVNQLTGNIPAEIGNLSNLEGLSLDYNQLTGSIPATIWILTNLEELYLNYNQLTGSIPVAIGNLTNLQNLGLSNNQLTDNIPAIIGNLTNLQYLYLSSNELNGSIPPEIGNLINLRVLALSNNQLIGSIPQEIGNLANLFDLELCNNQLTGSIPDEMCNLNYLDYFYFYNNYFDLGSCPAIACLANHRVYMPNNGSQLNGYNLLTDCEISVPVEIGVEQVTICYPTLYYFGDITVTNYTSIEWTSSWGGYFDDPYSLNPTFDPGYLDFSGGMEVYTFEIIVRAIGDYGWAEDVMYLNVQNCSVPTVIGLDDVWTCADGSGYYFGSVSMQDYWSFQWYTTNGTGFFDNQYYANPTYYPSEEDYLQGSVEIMVDAFGNNGPSSDFMTIHFMPQSCSLPVEIFQHEQWTCADNNGYSIWGVYYNGTWMVEWFIIDGSGSFDFEWNFYPTYYPSIQDYMEGSVILGVTAEGEYGIAQDYIVLHFENPPEVFAGVDATIAAGETITLSAATVINYSDLSWTTSGDGTFSSSTSINPDYTPGFADLLNGYSELCLTADTYICSNISDCMVLTINNAGTPALAVNPPAVAQSLSPGQSGTQTVVISNNGDGSLYWSLEIGQEAKVVQIAEPVATLPADEQSGLVDKGAKEIPGPPITDNAGGPDTFGYSWKDSNEPGGPAFSWQDISGSGNIITDLGDDSYLGPFPINFTFPFYENTYSEFYISSNGLISFGSGNSSYDNATIPNANTPNNFIAWCWDDLYQQSFSSVSYQTNGDWLIVQFKDYGECCGGSQKINAEVILYASGKIVIQYLNTANGFDTQGCTIGIENQSGTDGLQVAYNTAYIQENLAVEFKFGPQWLTASHYSGIINAGNSQDIVLSFDATGLEPDTYTANINITSNDPDNPLTSIPVTLTVVDNPLQNPDSLALVALYNATNGPNWTNKTNWLTGPLISWYGITVTDGFVIQVDLHQNHLVGGLPPEIGNLSHVQFINLSYNQISGSLPSEIGNLSTLNHLDLSMASFHTPIPPQIGNLSNLQHLILNGCQFTGIIPSEIGNLTLLQTLHLSTNQFTGSIPNQIENLMSLEYLSVADNQLIGEIPLGLWNLSNLQYLYLHSNQLSGSISPSISNLINLVDFYIENNQITGELPSEIGSLTNLQYSGFCCNQLSGSIPESFCNLQSLIEISIHDNYFDLGSCPAVNCMINNGLYFFGGGYQFNGLNLIDDCNPLFVEIGFEEDQICSTTTAYSFQNVTAGGYLYLQWNAVNGSGNFDDPFSLNPTYFPVLTDYQQGSVNLTIVAESATNFVLDTMTLFFTNPPFISAGFDATIAPNESFYIESATANDYSQLIWSTNGDGTFNDSSLIHPTYTAGSGDLQNGCVELILNALPVFPCTEAANDTMVLCFGGMISGVVAEQRTDGSKLVDIYYDLNSQDAENITLEASFDGGTVYQILTDISGDAGSNVSPGIGKHIVWEAGIEIPEISNDSTLFRITAGTPQWQCGQPFTDTRDGQIYATVQIGTQCWMAENLNIGNMLPGGSQQSNNGVVEKYCYNNDESNCNVYGGLYQWNEMMQYTTSSGVSGICPPEGEWRLPTDADWCLLTTFLDPSVNCIGTGFIGTNAGGKIKSTGTIEAGTGLWSGPNTGATNSSSFTALPGARYAGSFSFLGTYGYFWSSSQKDASNMWFYSASASSAEINRNAANFGHAYSVRCIKN